MTIAIVATIMALIIFPMLGAMWGAANGESLENAVVGFAAAFNLSLIGWIIFVAVHFITKYW